jgi:type IV pilus assembly protein PilQ
MKKYLRTALKVCLAAIAGYTSLAWSQSVQLEDMSFATLPGDRFEVKLKFADTPPAPKGYTIENPARIVLDFPGVESALEQKKYALSFENARSAVVLSTADRTRLILNMSQLAPYETSVAGNTINIVVGEAEGQFAQRSNTASEAAYSSASSTKTGSTGSAAVSNVDFKRGESGEGLVSIELTDPSVSVDVSQVGSDVQLSFFRTELPEALDRRLDVVDFATPVKEIDASFDGSTTVIAIDTIGEYDYLAYQADNKYVVSIKPLTDDEVEEKKRRFAYVGDKLSLNFQDIEVRSVLQLIADFTDLNLVASDTVSGNITLRLNNVPWDQALDIVLKAKGLDKRQEGNVLMVAPAAEIAERERLQVEANKQLQELAPLQTEFIRVRYADARELFELFDAEEGGSGGGGDENATDSILSERGSAIVDERTNTIILTDTEDKIAEFKLLISKIDIPIRQVLIEARIVIANTDFRREIGTRWGLQGAREPGDDLFGFSGSLEGFDGESNPWTIFSESFPTQQNFTPGEGSILVNDSTLGVDLGVANPAGSFALEFLTDNTFIDLEISALENDGKGEIVSQPKVLTGDKQKAVIKAGTEVAYQKATSSGATSIEFKEAVLKLEVVPQITPDNRIIMDLVVSQDSVGDLVFNGQPIIDITEIETQALVGDGQTLVLGGLFQMQTVDNQEKVPLLGDIPVLGRLFRKDIDDMEKREILIFITPKIIDDALLD